MVCIFYIYLYYVNKFILDVINIIYISAVKRFNHIQNKFFVYLMCMCTVLYLNDE